MAKAFKKLSSARLHAEGKPVARVGDLYIVGVSGTDEAAVIATDGGISGHVTLLHLDRLGNANYAIPGEARRPNGRAYPDGPRRDLIGLPMGMPEAMALWGLLDRVLAGQSVEVDAEVDGEKLRWTRDRLALYVKAAQAVR